MPDGAVSQYVHAPLWQTGFHQWLPRTPCTNPEPVTVAVARCPSVAVLLHGRVTCIPRFLGRPDLVT